jgi:restriction system protein
VKGVRRRRRQRRRRTGALETTLGVAALMAYLLGLDAWLIGRAVGALVALDVAVAVLRGCRRRRRLQTLQGFLALSPAGFEEAVAALLHRLGYRRVKVVGGAGDLCADIVCRGRAGELVIVQCKRYAPGHPVRSAEVQRVIGMAFVHHHAARAIFVTTSDFTHAARSLARGHHIELINGRRLVELAQRRPRRERSDSPASRPAEVTGHVTHTPNPQLRTAPAAGEHGSPR